MRHISIGRKGWGVKRRGGAGVYFAVEAMTNILRKLRARRIPAGGSMGLQDWFRRFHLDSVRIDAGVAAANISFRDADRDAAWELYIEMLTRIVTQPLPRELGDELTALDSVYALFGITREILRRQGRDTIQFTKVAVPVLNQVVRPFTAKWHKEGLAGAFNQDDMRAEYRDELANLQVELRKYTAMLAEIAGVEDLTNLESEGSN